MRYGNMKTPNNKKRIPSHYAIEVDGDERYLVGVKEMIARDALIDNFKNHHYKEIATDLKESKAISEINNKASHNRDCALIK